MTNYTAGMNFVCTPCTARDWGLAVACVVGVVSLVLGIGIVSYLVSPDTRGSGRGLVDRVSRQIPLHSLKIIIVAWQIVTQVRSIIHRLGHYICMYIYTGSRKTLSFLRGVWVTLASGKTCHLIRMANG